MWSWLSNRLVVWASDASLLLPDEIVALGFDIYERFDPVWLGIELDGLEQFLLQPFRHEMVRRGTFLPLRGLRAPRSKLDFIRGLQPFFSGREVEFSQPLPALTEQLLNFPRGRIDAPNALAYALQMRPGLAIYEGFSAEHIVPDLDFDHTRPLFLAANATGAMTAAVLVQHVEGRFLVLADWLREGSPAECVPPIHADAILAAESLRAGIRQPAREWSGMLKQAAPTPYIRAVAPTWVIPPHHGERYTNVGLQQAIRAIPATSRLGGEGPQGQIQLSNLFGSLSRGLPAAAIGTGARWTLRALSGGYSRPLLRGKLADHAEEGPYRLLMEGIESFLGLQRLSVASDDDMEDMQPTAVDAYGRRYRTAMPARR